MSTEDAPITVVPPIPTPPVAAPEGATPETGQLGAPGLAALKSEREAKAAAEKRAADAEARIKEFEDRDKTEAQKQADALAEAQAKVAELTAGKTRAEVAAAKGVPVGLISGATKEELEASADALIAFKGDTQPQRLYVPGEGHQPSKQFSDDQQFVGKLFGGN